MVVFENVGIEVSYTQCKDLLPLKNLKEKRERVLYST